MNLASVVTALAIAGAPKSSTPAVADAIVRNAKTPAEAAFLIAWAEHESHFDLRIANNDCHPWECDHGRARGLWQSHERAAGTAWAHLPGDIDLQAFVAVRHARWAIKDCGSVLGGFRRLGGLACDRPLKGEAGRMESYRRILAVLR